MKRAVSLMVCSMCAFLGACQSTGQKDAHDSSFTSAIREEISPAPGRVRTFYRGNNRVLAEYAFTENRRCRVFYESGRKRMVESDEDGDGFFETISLFAENAAIPSEVFVRSKDGTVRPMESRDLDRLRAAIAEALDEAATRFNEASRNVSEHGASNKSSRNNSEKR